MLTSSVGARAGRAFDPSASFLGSHVQYEVRVDALQTTLRVQTLTSGPRRSGRVRLRLPPERLVALGRVD